MKHSIGFKRICAVVLSLLLLAGVAGATVAVKAASSNETAVYNYLKNEMSLNTAAACGVLANISIESEFDPHCSGDNDTSYGICQWHADRYDRLKSYCAKNGYDHTTLNGQLHYLHYELKNYYPTVYNKLHSVPDTAQGAYDAAYTWCYSFEVPYGYNSGVSDKRGYLAMYTYWPVYSANEQVPSTTQPVQPPENPHPDDIGFVGSTATMQIFSRFIQLLRTIITALKHMLV